MCAEITAVFFLKKHFLPGGIITTMQSCGRNLCKLFTINLKRAVVDVFVMERKFKALGCFFLWIFVILGGG